MKILKNILLVILTLACILISGCAYNRKTEDGALAKCKFELELLPSGSSDDDIVLSNKAIETTTVNADRTNAHTSGIKKTEARANVTTTTTAGPGQNTTSWTPGSRENVRN